MGIFACPLVPNALTDLVFVVVHQHGLADSTEINCEKLNLWVGPLQKQIKGLFQTMVFSSPIC